jgi:hypothetical protein
MADNFAHPEFPEEIEAKIHAIAAQTGASYDDVVNSLMRAFFDMVDGEPKIDEPALVKTLRAARLTRPRPESESN